MRGVIGILTGKGPACDELSNWLDREAGVFPSMRPYEESRVIRINRKPGNQIAWQRNQIIRELEPDDEFLLFIDNDNVPPPGALDQLWAASKLSGIAAATVIERVLPFEVCAVKTLEPHTRFTVANLAGMNQPFPVVAAGTGCMMIRRDVFRDLSDPWFRCGQIHPALISEDLDFCLRAAEVGHPTYLVPTVRVGHEASVILYPGDDGEIWAQWNDHGGRANFRMLLPMDQDTEVHG